VAQAFHAALAAGDSGTALQLLASDVLVLESGALETLDEYRAHHLPGDIQFARAVSSSRTVTRLTVRGDVAWVVAASQATGTFRERAVNSAGVELMVLTREPAGWRVRAIHWSSRARRAAAAAP
jgi:ketosteroid isomerase-like protein